MSNARLYAIYNADGSLLGELAYFFGKCTGRSACALCDLSHGWHPFGRRAWRQRQGLMASIQWLHRDELPTHFPEQLIRQLPCVVVERLGQFEILIDSESLSSCHADFGAFERLLANKWQLVVDN